VGANLWSWFQTLNQILGARGYLRRLWPGVGGPAYMRRQGNAAEHKNAAKHKNLDLLPPCKLEHRCFGATPLKWSHLLNGFRPGQFTRN